MYTQLFDMKKTILTLMFALLGFAFVTAAAPSLDDGPAFATEQGVSLQAEQYQLSNLELPATPKLPDPGLLSYAVMEAPTQSSKAFTPAFPRARVYSERWQKLGAVMLHGVSVSDQMEKNRLTRLRH